MSGQRRIDNVEYNNYIKNGVKRHTPTSMVPESFLDKLDSNTEEDVVISHKNIVKLLNKVIGKPYYSKNGFIIYNTDSVDMMQKMKETEIKIDLTITSPPYNIGKEYEKQMKVAEYIMWCGNWMELIYSITNVEGAFWLNVGFFEVPDAGLCVPIAYLLWDKSSFYLIQELVWKYGAGVSTKKRLSPRNEKWLFYTKQRKNYTFNLDSIRDPNVKYPNQKKNGKYRCNPLGKNPGDVWEISKVTTGTDRSSKERTGHPSQFPLRIVENIIKVSSNPTDIVFDPFAGSFSSGITAYAFGRVFIGSEISEKYCEMAVNRFLEFEKAKKKHTQQLLLLSSLSFY